MIFIAVTQNYWGKGATIPEALSAMKDAGATPERGQPIDWSLFVTSDPDAKVNGLGGFIYHACGSGLSIYRGDEEPRLVARFTNARMSTFKIKED